jgi:phosphocarrier protein HPr
MITAKILLDSVQKVKEFSSVVAKMEAECELVQGARILDAKSIMGIFSLDLQVPVELKIDTDASELPKSLKKFLAE